MINSKRILALIPARGGSKGIKNKNIINLAGKPLIAYSIEAALHSKYIDNVVVTTDSPKIAASAKQYGASVPFMRPAELAEDTSKTIDAVLHAIETLKQLNQCFDILILLQATSPLRTSNDIDAAIEKFIAENMQSLLSVSLVNDHPLLIRTINEDGNLCHLLSENSTCRRQDMPPYYRVNGSIYINLINTINSHTSLNDNGRPFIMENAHSLDIDELSDLVMAEYYLRTNGI